MREIIYSLPDQILEIIKLVKNFGGAGREGQREEVKRVLICGMGGSGISGELISAIYPEIEIIVNKDYRIPGYIDKKTLAILISYSGNTEETLTNYKILSKNKIPIIAISSDGELLKKEALLKIEIPKGLPPRGALGYLFTPIPFLLYRAGLLKPNPEKEIYNLSLFLKKQRNSLEKEGRGLAQKLVGKLPVIYANSFTFGVVANRWRCQFNENAKILCHTNIIPEMNHNEIVGLGRPGKFNKDILVIFLNDPAAYPRNKLRVRIIKELIKDELPGIIEINPKGKNRIQQAFWTIMLGDFTSFHLAIKTGIDPMPVKRIDYLKRRLTNRTHITASRQAK